VVEAIERRIKRDRLAHALDETWAAALKSPHRRSPEEILAWANAIREQDRPDAWEESRRLARKARRTPQ
jgi:hypothetical protein